MFRFVRLWLGLLPRCFRSHRRLLVENLALRQQLIGLKRLHPRPRFGLIDKLFWRFACRWWSQWKQSLILVTPETVVRWHRAGFRMYRSMISRVRSRVGRRRISSEVRDEIVARRTRRNPSTCSLRGIWVACALQTAMC